jgi:hypothetical protein
MLAPSLPSPRAFVWGTIMKSRSLTGFAILCCASVLFAPGAIAGQTTQESAVLAAVQSLLDGWREADPGKLEAVLHKDFREVTLHLQDQHWNFSAVDRESLFKSVARIPKGAWDDRLIHPQVLVDGPIAVVWSRYEFTVHYSEDGVAHAPVHCGIETFQLYQAGSDWKIVNFADTHSDRCP